MVELSEGVVKVRSQEVVVVVVVVLVAAFLHLLLETDQVDVTYLIQIRDFMEAIIHKSKLVLD